MIQSFQFRYSPSRMSPLKTSHFTSHIKYYFNSKLTLSLFLVAVSTKYQSQLLRSMGTSKCCIHVRDVLDIDCCMQIRLTYLVMHIYTVLSDFTNSRNLCLEVVSAFEILKMMYQAPYNHALRRHIKGSCNIGWDTMLIEPYCHANMHGVYRLISSKILD